MRTRNTRRVAAVAAAVLGAGLALASCANDNSKGGSAGGTWPGADKSECKGLEQLADYGDLSGREVGVYTSIVAPEDQAQKDSYKPFEDCTGAKVNYEGSKEFEAQLPVRVQAGNPPDIAYVPQPGLLKHAGRHRQRRRRRRRRSPTNVDKWWGADWKYYGTVDGKFYAAPLGANVKSFVWYSPKMFKPTTATTVPTTWDELIDAVRHDRRHRRSSRGAPASSPVRPPAGRPPTGSRTSCSAPPARTSTTSGSTTRSRSTTRRSPTALDDGRQHPQEPEVRQRRHR